MRHQLTLPLLVLFLVAVPVSAGEDDAGTLIDRIVRSPAWLGTECRVVCDFTREVNALLARDTGEVFAALAEGLKAFEHQDFFEDRHRVALETLAALVVGEEFEPEDWQSGVKLRTIAGFVVAIHTHEAGFFSGPDPWKPPPPLNQIVRGRTTLRAALEPDGGRLLGMVTEPPQELRAMLRYDFFRRSAGLALGRAAREDAGLARKLVAEVDKHPFARATQKTLHLLDVLCFALGRLASPEARQALTRKFLEVAALEDRKQRLAGLLILPDAARAGFDESFLVEVRERLAQSAAPGALEDFDRDVGGDPAILPRLEAARAAPTAANLGALAEAVEIDLYHPSPETFIDVLDLALRCAAAKEAATREAAVRVIRSLLWPLDEGKKQVPGYPDPLEQARRFRQALRSGRVKLEPATLSTPGIFHKKVWAGPPEEGEVGAAPDSGIRIMAKRQGDSLLITIWNGGDRACCVNPVAMEYGTMSMREGAWREGEPRGEAPHIQLGRIATDMQPTVRASKLVLLKPGESTAVTWSLQPGLPLDASVFVHLQDEIAVEGDLPAPLVVYTPAARAR